ncbi:TetR/AcrR family transcriptional regulator [Aneurinibacillus uraniidurans]|uniref:TetR/AcrR family transcriptional regulator n=1 Tax=Aneurinibacillus uraniidurans TaxID=2966586 RepID=UPI00234B5E8B|nr:TetR/AcrR family transcriptional regulator [Aneurinibacillus sp. B1]WCN37117.1 TetR/AcrR family transcriptional regulator [Aneurinibacillus sp. B1]
MDKIPSPLFDEAIKNMLDSLKDEEEMTDKQRRILESAIKIFAEKGFHGSSTSEIARDAEVAEGTIFRHFKTKKDLLYALIAPMMIKFASPLLLKDVQRIIHEDLAADEMLYRLYKNRLDIIEANWSRMRIIVQEAWFHPEIMDALIQNITWQGRNLGDSFVRARIESGEFRDLPVHAITRAVFSTLFGCVMFSHMFTSSTESMNTEDDIRLAVDILLNGIRNR